MRLASDNGNMDLVVHGTDVASKDSLQIAKSTTDIARKNMDAVQLSHEKRLREEESTKLWQWRKEQKQ